MKFMDDESDNVGSDADKPLQDGDGNVDTDKVQDVASDEADRINDARDDADNSDAA